ncbi:Trm112 family protein [Candidatus Erwinia haradaeae]|uniref:UPF0434 protein YcaR n=1 Tax=Candidatus Erwinia haradaeae TaxID=1922217 RepID=A0A451D3A4_9GAMM|nr:Trm112 family protein [Candidatus Erwinia haradaeae]VFP80141.1 UPF0434 protein YcaR [Candidatus Erwinia haradaeae]
MHPFLINLIACPICHSKLKLFHTKETLELVCKSDKLSYPIREGIPVLLTTTARPLNQ